MERIMWHLFTSLFFLASGAAIFAQSADDACQERDGYSYCIGDRVVYQEHAYTKDLTYATVKGINPISILRDGSSYPSGYELFKDPPIRYFPECAQVGIGEACTGETVKISREDKLHDIEVLHIIPKGKAVYILGRAVSDGKIVRIVDIARTKGEVPGFPQFEMGLPFRTKDGVNNTFVASWKDGEDLKFLIDRDGGKSVTLDASTVRKVFIERNSWALKSCEVFIRYSRDHVELENAQSANPIWKIPAIHGEVKKILAVKGFKVVKVFSDPYDEVDSAYLNENKGILFLSKEKFKMPIGGGRDIIGALLTPFINILSLGIDKKGEMLMHNLRSFDYVLVDRLKRFGSIDREESMIDMTKDLPACND